MKLVCGVVVLMALTLSACGGCGDGNPTMPDSSAPQPDARLCTGVTAGPLEFIEYDPQGIILWRGPVTGTTGDGLTLFYNLEFYDGIEPSLSGTFDLAAGNQSNYETCAICVRALAVDAAGDVVKYYFQKAGSITLTQNPVTTQHVIGTITGLQLEEVTIDQSYHSTPVAGGACTDFAMFNVDRDDVPTAYTTCARNTYDDGINCNCLCGAPDPDCEIDAAPVMGCATVGNVCFNDTCVTKPANDTCADATALTINDPAVTGTTVGAAHNYDSGLEGATCTDDPQPGRDVVYSVTLTAAQAITVSLTGVATTFDASIALLGPAADATVCDASPITTCVEGVDTIGNGVSETFMFTATDPGTYYIIVDSWSAAGGGAFSLAVTSP